MNATETLSKSKVRNPSLLILSRDLQSGSGQATSISLVIQSAKSCVPCIPARRGSIAPAKDQISEMMSSKFEELEGERDVPREYIENAWPGGRLIISPTRSK